MLNFLYCLDSNYNQQFLTSFRSVLDNLDEKANFFVIHKNPATLNQLIANVNFEHSNINELKIYKFKEEIKEFPNLENNHISEATYYRFFLDNYINKNIENIIYLDCDIICLNNPKNKPNVLSIDPTPVQLIALPRLLPITIVKKRVKKKTNTPIPTLFINCDSIYSPTIG